MIIRKNTFIPNLVSIVTAAFNSEKWISDCIESVVRQEYREWELLIVIDTGTFDKTEQIVDLYSQRDQRIRLIKISDGRGLALARNRGITEAKGQYLAFLDSDDYWLPHKLRNQIAFMRQNKYGFTCSGFRRINENGFQTGRLIMPPSHQTYQDLLKHNFIPCLTVIIDRNQIPDFEFTEYKFEDFILWLQILKKTDACYCLQEDLTRYRIVENSRSTQTNSLKMRWQVYIEFENLSSLKALYYMIHYVWTALFKRTRF
jgi:teichuronic acid biosynthesis glycosyltransferase TuaG